VSETIVKTGLKLALTGTIRAPGQSLAGWRRKPAIVREIRGWRVVGRARVELATKGL